MNQVNTSQKPCLICQEPISPFISFGRMPLGNGFLTPEQFDEEYFFNLNVGFCPRCSMVQLTELVDRDRMFHDHYAFYSSTSKRMADHFATFAAMVKQNYLQDTGSFVVELGSNDGIMLRRFAHAGMRHLGIEPSANVAKEALAQGIRTITEFFDEQLADRIASEHGQADAILSANVMCHIPYLHSVAKGIKRLLKPAGVFCFEDPYLGDIVEKTSYDQIYDEHAFYFSLLSVSALFNMHGLEVVDVQPQHVHGGSMRYIIMHAGTKQPSPAVVAQRQAEERLGLGDASTYDRFRHNVQSSRDKLIELLRNLRKQGKRVVGYGATSKSTTVTNYCGITPDLVEFISDTTPIKQGKFSPGAHLPVKPYEAFQSRYPDYALLFAWNHREEIMAKEQAFRDAGGKWITYVPNVQVLG